MNSADQVYRALQRHVDERGYVRIRIDDIVEATGFSRATVKRALTELVTAGQILRRSKGGPDGGLLIRLKSGSESGSQPAQNPVQNEPDRDVFKTQTPDPKGQGGLVSEQVVTGSPSTTGRGSPAWRPAAPYETPESGAELVYTGPEPDGNWKRLNATLWIAPNGDAVSIRSMSPELRMRLRVEENADGTPNAEAIRAIRGILDR